MFYRRQGRGEALIVLHGFASSSLFWTALMEQLGEHFDVIAPDWPGFGATPEAAPYTTLADFAGGVIDLADKLGLERFHVIGHSMSGFVVQTLLCERAHRLNNAVLYGAGLGVNRARRFETIAETLRRLQTEGVDATLERIVSSWFADPVRNAKAYRLCVEAARGMSMTAAAAAIHAMESADFTGLLGEAQTRTLVISGEAERSHPPPSAIELQKALPNGHLCVLPCCGHAAHLEQPEWFEMVVRDFLLPHSR